MLDENTSAIAAIKVLRDEVRARLEENEDFRAWRALDAVVRQLEPRGLPAAPGLADNAMNFLDNGHMRKFA